MGFDDTGIVTESRRHLIVVFAFGVTLRLVLLALYPVPYGHDGFGRLYFSDRIFLSHWLPLTQAVVYFAAWTGMGPQLIRAVFAVLASLAGCGFYLLLRHLVTREMALLGSLIFSANALMIVLSLMPYQDVLFLGLLFGGLGCMFAAPSRLKGVSESILFGLACLTRYESWFLMPLLVGMRSTSIPARRSPRGPTNPGRDVSEILTTFAGSLIYFCWAPLLWFLLSSLHYGSWDGFLYQTSEGSFYAWEPRVDPIWALGYARRMLYWIGLFGSPLVLLSLLGLFSIPEKLRRSPRLMAVLGFWGLSVLLFFFFIMDRAQESVFRFVLAPLALVLVLTVFGLERLAVHTAGLSRALRNGLAVALLVPSVLVSALHVSRLGNDPEHRAPYRVARFLESHPEGQVLVVADRSRQLDDAAPLAYQRIVAQFDGERNRIDSAGLLPLTEPGQLWTFARDREIRFIVLFEDFEPWLPADRFFARLIEDQRVQAEVVMNSAPATVYKVDIDP